MLSISSIVQNVKDLQGKINVSTSFSSNLQLESFIVTLGGGFIVMRVFKTLANILLSNKMPSIIKMLGNGLMIGTVIAASGGSLISAAH